MLHRSGSNSILGTLAYNNPPLECRCFLLVLNFRQPLAVPSLWAFRLSWLAPHSQCSSEGNHLRPVCPFEIRLFSHDSGAVFSGLSIVNLIFLLCCAANDICFFFQYCACECTKRFEKWKVIFEFTNSNKDLPPQITNQICEDYVFEVFQIMNWISVSVV